MPLFSPTFCEKHCPVCTRARQGRPLARFLQKIELTLTLGGCPFGRARRRATGITPDQSLPTSPPNPPIR